MKKAPKPKKVGRKIKDQQEYLRYTDKHNDQFEKGTRFNRKQPIKKSTGLLSGKD